MAHTLTCSIIPKPYPMIGRAPGSRSAERRCRMESLLSERTDASPDGASGGAPRAPGRSACGSAYFTCRRRSGHERSRRHFGGRVTAS